MSKVVQYYSVMFGADPELFFAKKDGEVIGAEKILPATGRIDKFVLDGVQVELNPNPDTCRARFSNQLAVSFRTLRDQVLKTKGVDLSFEGVVTVSKEELASLSEKSRLLGCGPSLNHYDKDATIGVNPATYQKRSAGGHIHLGFSGAHEMMAHRTELVPILDALVGNTAVLIDRDPNAVERRKVYGRAGEHRLPNHGVEYRTLSNFWLRNYKLMSLMFGLSRLATSVLYTTYKTPPAPFNENSFKGYHYSPTQLAVMKKQYEDRIAADQPWDAKSRLLDAVDLKKIAHAINTNDADLAWENWQPVKAFLEEHVTAYMDCLGLGYGMTDTFEWFAKKVQEKGLSHFFPLDPLKHWCSKQDGHGTGWESWCTGELLILRNQASVMPRT